MRIRVLAPVLGLSLAASLSAQSPPGGLHALLESHLKDFPARTGLYVKHLATGEEAAVRGDEPFSSASVIKLAIMIRAYQLAEAKTLDLGERVTITRADLRDGSGVLQYHELGLSPTYRDLITQMVITSDNTATDLMVRKIGGVDALNIWLAASGFTNTRMIGRGHEYRRKLLTLLHPEFANLTPEETTGLQYASQGSVLFGLYADLFTGPRARWVAIVRDPANRRALAESRNRLTVQDRAYWLGEMTPRETGRLLEAIERGTLTSPASAAEMKTIMSRQQAGSRRLPHFLTVPVAHKTGDSAVIANDVGLVSARSGTVIISFFVNGVTGSYGEAEDRIGRAARDLVDYFDRAQPRPGAAPAPAPAPALPAYERRLLLETTAETSANVSIGDVNGDGHPDIVLAKGRHWPLVNRVLLGDGRGGFPSAHDLGTAADRTYSGHLVDLDGDGDLDVAISNDRDPKLVYLNDGTGRFSPGSTYGEPDWPTRNATVVDLNADGLPDIVVANRTGNRPGASYICFNKGRGRFDGACEKFATESATTITAADVTGDGLVDLIVPHRDGGQSHIYVNGGTGTFLGATRVPFGPANATIRMSAAADLNGDGRQDLVTIDERAGVAVYFGEAGSRLSAAVPIGLGDKSPYALATGDLDGNGTTDIVVGYVEARPAVLFNDGSGRHFTPVPFGDDQGTAYGFAIGDVDQDGRLDIAVARSEAPNVLYFGGSGAQAAATPAPARRVIQPPGYKPTPSPLVPAILVGDTLYLSGSTGGDPVSGQLVPGGLEPEMKQIMSNVQTVLAAAGMSLRDVVKVTVYLADMADFARFNQLYTSYFPDGAYPTRSTVAVKDLARGARLEITMTAVRSQ
jgi:reactive intermediate/imine deaminase